MCFGIDLISSFAVWRPSGVVQGLQTPPGTPDGVWRPSGVKSSLQALRGLKVSGGPARPLRTFRHLQTPQIESGGPQGSPRASTQPPDTSRHPKSSRGPQESPRSAQRRAGAGKGLVGDPRALGPCRHLGGGIWAAPACWDESRPSQASPNMTWRPPPPTTYTPI